MKNNIKTIFIGIIAFFAFLIKTCKSELGILRNETKIMSNVIKEDAAVAKTTIHENPVIANEFKSVDNSLNFEKATKEEAELYKNLKDELKDELKDKMQEFLTNQYMVSLAIDEIMGDASRKNKCIKELNEKKYITNSNSDKEIRLLLFGNLLNKKKLDTEYRTYIFTRYSEKYFCYAFSNLINQEKLDLVDLKLIDEISKSRQIKNVDFLNLLQFKISKFK